MDIAILLFDGFDELDAFGPFEVLRATGLDAALVSTDPTRLVTSASGAQVSAHAMLGEAPRWLVIPGGGWASEASQGVHAEIQRGTLPQALARCARDGSAVAAVCTGALLAGAAGLLEGRPATTHHRAFDELARYGARVVRDARVVDDGTVVTAGGVTSGIDLGLWLVRRECGAAMMRSQERRLEHRLGKVDDRRPAAPSPRGEDAVAAFTSEVQAPDGWLPQTALAHAAYDLAKSTEPPYLFNHSVRSYLFARLVAAWQGRRPDDDFDNELLFLACTLHDLGLADAATTAANIRSDSRSNSDSPRRFELVGAEAAATFLARHGLAEPFAGVVADAITLHTSAGIAERRSPESALARAGISMDFGADADLVPDAVAAAIHDSYPRLDITRCIVDAIVAQTGDNAAAAPAYALPGELLRERREPPFVSRLERRAAASRWGS